MVQTTDQAAQPWWWCIGSCFWLPGSHPLPHQCWFSNNHVSGVKINKIVTTLSSVIARILEEKCHLTEDNWAALQKQETMFTALEHKACTSRKKFCMNCMWDNHCSHDCYGPGGVKEHEHPCKGNVQLKEHIMTTDFSNYTTSTKCPAGSYFTSQLVENSAYSTHKSLSSPTAIIDSHPPTYTPITMIFCHWIPPLAATSKALGEPNHTSQAVVLLSLLYGYHLVTKPASSWTKLA